MKLEQLKELERIARKVARLTIDLDAEMVERVVEWADTLRDEMRARRDSAKK